jgi:hypothetical protein
MCYENMLRSKRWTCGPRTRYVSYPPAGRQQENSQAEHPPPFDFDRTNSHHRKQIQPLGRLPPMGQPSPPSRAIAFSAREGRVIHSTARAHWWRWRRSADGRRPLAVLGRLVCRHPLCIDALYVAALSTAASHTPSPSCPPSLHTPPGVRGVEHVACARVGSWCPLSRALAAGSRAALAVAWARQLPAVPSGRRDGVAREQGRLAVAFVRAGRGWGCSLLGTGAARLTTKTDGQPARPARAVHAPRQSRPRGAGVAVKAAGATLSAMLRSPPRRRPRSRGCLRCKCGRRAIVGGRPSRTVVSWAPGGHVTRRAPAPALKPAQDEEEGARDRAALVALE